MEAIQVILSISVPTMAVLVGILINNSRLGDLRAHMDVRFSEVDRRFGEVDKHLRSLEKLFDEKLLRVEQVIDARLSSIEKNLEKMRH
jgi:F0F1-type ATP synthase delta subunit